MRMCRAIVVLLLVASVELAQLAVAAETDLAWLDKASEAFCNAYGRSYDKVSYECYIVTSSVEEYLEP